VLYACVITILLWDDKAGREEGGGGVFFGTLRLIIGDLEHQVGLDREREQNEEG